MAPIYETNKLIKDINPNPAPIRKRSDYQKLASSLGDAITDLVQMSTDPNANYQKEAEACSELSIAAYRLMKYIEKNAWNK